MKIKFNGVHSTEELLESLAAVLRMLQEQYGVEAFNEIDLQGKLLSGLGEELELMDLSSSEVFDTMEVHKHPLHSEDYDGVDLEELANMSTHHNSNAIH